MSNSPLGLREVASKHDYSMDCYTEEDRKAGTMSLKMVLLSFKDIEVG